MDQRRDELRTLDETLESDWRVLLTLAAVSSPCCRPRCWTRTARSGGERGGPHPYSARPGGPAGSISCTAWPSPRAELGEAETWLSRGIVLSGEHALFSAAAGLAPADVTVRWTASMGVRRPSGISCTVPARPTSAATPGTTALVHAEAAYRQAVRAATDHGCARAAARIVGAEVASTSRRVRALRRHWIPRLQEALAHVDLAPEQSEHEDSVRRRWAAQVLKGRERQTERDGPSEDRSARR
ncbi:V-type ATP synthase subunit D [Streptomyces mirabilis]|uniref:V-type ATP synthase subunit D n=1 Tax=Streptomyces mirabilis TaxID=68239 RepID=UPI0036C14E65